MRMLAWVAGIVFLADQALKYWVVHVINLDSIREYDLLPPWLNLRMAWNQGVNFGLFATDQSVMRWVLIGIALAICLWVWIWIWRARLGRLPQFAAGLLIGGALGNVVDRLAYGAVADFLNMSLPGWQNPYSFNVADIAIFAGAIGLVLMPQKPKAAKPATKKPRRAPVPPKAPGAKAPVPAAAEDEMRPDPRQGDLFAPPAGTGARKPVKAARDGGDKSR